MQIDANILSKTDELFMKWFTDQFIYQCHLDILKKLKNDCKKSRVFNVSFIPSSPCSANHYKFFTANNHIPRSFTPPAFQCSPNKSQRQNKPIKLNEIGETRSTPFLKIIQEKSSCFGSSVSPSGCSVNGGIQINKDVKEAFVGVKTKLTDEKRVKPIKSVTKKDFSTNDRCETKSLEIAKFYFPRGKPKPTEEIGNILKSISEKLQQLETRSSPASPLTIHRSKMDDVTRILNVPLYWKILVFNNSGGNENIMTVYRENIVSMWQKIIVNNHSDGSKLFYLLTQDKKPFVEPTDFYPFVQDVLETHPGLTFLLSARDFHSRYIATVVYRIFFCINYTWTGKLTLQELEKSDLLSVINSLETTEDINTITQYFSYEHFYVIYCKFWELDEDHDLVISKSDLARHNNYAISERMIERIFSGAVTKGKARTEGLMTYTEFVWFLLAEEDKKHPRSIEYWFRCMDLDGDGILSLYELDYFYQEQLFRMEEMGIEPISFEDCICQMMDMIKPKAENKIRLSDLKNCRLVQIFFDTFFNLTKYLEHEQRDPFTNLKDLEGVNEMSDWNRFASEAYEILVAEDGSQNNYNENYRDSAQVFRNPLSSNDDDEVSYESVTSKQNATIKKSDKFYETSKYNDFVNEKLSDSTDKSSVTSISYGKT